MLTKLLLLERFLGSCMSTDCRLSQKMLQHCAGTDRMMMVGERIKKWRVRSQLVTEIVIDGLSPPARCTGTPPVKL